MWYCFMLDGQMEIIMLSLKQIKVGRVNEIILGKYPTATDIREATNDEVTAVIQRAKDEWLQREIDTRCPCFAKALSECNCEV